MNTERVLSDLVTSYADIPEVLPTLTQVKATQSLHRL